MATAKEEKQFAKERAKRLKEKRAAYRAAKKAGTLDARQLSPEHMRYLRRKAVVEKVWPFFRFFIIFGLCFVILYPLIYMISTAFRPNDQMQDPSVIWIPKSLTLDNIKETWKTIDYFWTFLNTVKLNIIASLLQVVTCALTGYGFARFNFKGKKILFAVVIMMIIVPPQIIVIPTFMQFSYFRAFGIVEQLIKLFPSYFQSTYNASRERSIYLLSTMVLRCTLRRYLRTVLKRDCLSISSDSSLEACQRSLRIRLIWTDAEHLKHLLRLWCRTRHLRSLQYSCFQ